MKSDFSENTELNNQQDEITYENAGVSIATGDALIETIKPVVSQTHNNGVMGNLGGFGALFDLKATGYQDPILVSGTDGVGTKLLPAIETGLCDNIGFDLVGMCVNDIVVQGARPLFFLDYFATGKLELDQAQRIIQSISKACEASGCALIGGETAEMPGMYKEKHYDLAGFAVGAVERDQILPKNITSGDKIIALTSNGVHSNGFSLVRSIVKAQNLSWEDVAPFDPNQFLGEALLAPTQLYVKPVLKLHEAGLLNGAAHITGGGIVGNLPRILPDNLVAVVDGQSWPMPPVFSWLAHAGNVQPEEMLKVFNCGIGMILITSDFEAVNKLLNDTDVQAYIIGQIEPKTELDNDQQVFFSDLPDFTFIPEID